MNVLKPKKSYARKLIRGVGEMEVVEANVVKQKQDA